MKKPLNIIPYKIFANTMNMAIDEVLFLISIDLGLNFLRFYGWDKPCITYGYFQNPEINKDKKITYVRRLTGGGTVIHENDLTFSYCGHLNPPFNSTKEIYNIFGSLIMKSLSSVSKTNHLELVKKNRPLDRHYNCFDTPVIEDILFKDKKVYGGAIRKRKGSFLFHGTIQGSIVKNRKEIMKTFISSANEYFSKINDFKLSKSMIAQAKKLAKDKYNSDEWNMKKRGS